MKSRKTLICKLILTVPSVALFVYVMATARPVHATFPGTNGQIVFNQGDLNGVGPSNIFTANPDGSSLQQVPLGDPVDFFGAPVWSPDGSKLLISHTFRIDPSTGQCCLPFRPAIVSPDGSGYTLLMIPSGPFDMDCLVWSRDQSRLLCGFGDQNAGVFSIRASDGGDPVRLTTNPYAAAGGFDSPTDMSPDGTRFVFIRFKGGALRARGTEQQALFVENIDGTGVRQITPYGIVGPGDFASAKWSPDGTQIISETTHQGMFVVRPDGTGFTPIHLRTGAAQFFPFEPHWSPDGTRIVFEMFINGGEGIYTANPDGSNLKQVTFTTDFLTLFKAPDWGTHPLQ